MGRQQYYSRYNSRSSRRKKPKMLIYFVLISLLVIGVGFFGKTYLSVSNLVMTTAQSNQLEFEAIPKVTKWHNKEVRFAYLTFDDGPSRNVDKVLDILEDENIDGTFFLLGSAVETNPESERILKRMMDEGHYIGLHSMTHRYDHLYVGDEAPQNFIDEMTELQDLIAELTGGYESQLCRAPFGTGGTFTDGHIEALKEANMKCWDWDVDSMDWSYSPAQMLEKIKADLYMWGYPSHAVILFHEKDTTLEVLPDVIEYLRSEGYEFLPYNPDNHFPKNLYNSDEI